MTDMAATRARTRARSEEFAAFYAETAAPLARYAYQLVGDTEIASDIVQEAYARLLSRWVTIRKPRPYLFHAVTNLARDAWSGRRRGEALVRGVLDARPVLTVPATDTSVRDAVDRLPTRYREIVLLHYYADLPLSDVAAIVRRPVGSVKRMASEARDLLATALREAR